MMVFKRKQIVVLSLVLMVLVAGYLQYNYKQSSISVSGEKDGKIGEAVYVESDGFEIADKEGSEDKKDSGKEGKEGKDGKDGKEGKEEEATSASKEVNDYFAQAKMDKDVTRSKGKDALKAITEDDNATKEIKTEAYEKMMHLVALSEKEMKVESLIKKKGYKDVLALFGDDGSLDIVIKAPKLTATETAQIVDVVSRQANVDINNIHISNTY